MGRFSKRYAACFFALLAVEIFIAVAVHDRFVRPFVGDVLVVALVYCFVRTFVDLQPRAATVLVFCFACAVEIAQYFDVVHRLHVAHIAVLRVALGTHFDPMDFVAYATGALLILLAEKALSRAGRA